MTNLYASPPCFAHELLGGEHGAEAVDPQTALDVARWRKAERTRLIDTRLAVSTEERAKAAERVTAMLDVLIGEVETPVVSTYWPFRGELDLRPWMTRLTDAGARVVLPVVVEKAQPLIFREWTAGCRMERGVWNIPVPAEGKVLVPSVVVSPVVGVDAASFRLGYGGGFYDRTLAAMGQPRLVIGIGHPSARIATIYPQPHDVPMDVVVLGEESWRQPR